MVELHSAALADETGWEGNQQVEESRTMWRARALLCSFDTAIACLAARSPLRRAFLRRFERCFRDGGRAGGGIHKVRREREWKDLRGKAAVGVFWGSSNGSITRAGRYQPAARDRTALLGLAVRLSSAVCGLPFTSVF